MPEYLKRRKYAPTESEIEAIQVRYYSFLLKYIGPETDRLGYSPERRRDRVDSRDEGNQAHLVHGADLVLLKLYTLDCVSLEWASTDWRVNHCNATSLDMTGGMQGANV